jgi:hypothetical protein
MTHPLPDHVQQLMSWADHLKGFSHVIEDIFLLPHGNVIQQALLYSWGASNNLCTIYMFLTVPLHPLQVTYGRTCNERPLSNAYKNQITHFQNMYDCCSCKTAWSNHKLFDLTSSHFDSYCMLITHNHDWLPQVLPALMLLYVIVFLWSYQSVPMMGRSQEHSSILNIFLRNHYTFMMR